MTYTAKLCYRGIIDNFKVDDAGNGEEWGRIRAISHFLYKHQLYVPGDTFSEVAALALADGLCLTFLPVRP